MAGRLRSETNSGCAMSPMCSRLGVPAILCCLAAAVLAGGCSGGGGPSVAPVIPFDPNAYQVTINTENEAANRYATSLSQGAAFPDAAQQTLTWAEGLPNVVESGVAADGKTFWLEFDTGIALIVTTLPEATASSIPPVPALTTAGRDVSMFPGANQALDINAQWPGLDDTDNLGITGLLQQRGYSVVHREGQQVTVAAFRDLYRYNVVYIDTHGPSSKDLPKYGPVFITREPVSNTKDNQVYANDLRQKRLIHAVVVPESAARSRAVAWGETYAVTALDIIAMGGDFPARSFVFANACSSSADSSMSGAFRANGLYAYAGWSGPANLPAVDQAAFWVFRYMVGGPGQDDSPANLDNARQKVVSAGWETDVGANLVVPYGADFGVMPHLDSYQVQDDTLIVSGSFGTQQGTVTVDDTPFPIVSWSTSEIRCSIPANAQSGELVVGVGDLKSNPLLFGCWFEHFERAPAGAIQFTQQPDAWYGYCPADLIPTSQPAGGRLTNWRFRVPSNDGTSGAEITSAKTMRLWAMTSVGGTGTDAYHDVFMSNGQPILLAPGLRFKFAVSCLAQWPSPPTDRETYRTGAIMVEVRGFLRSSPTTWVSVFYVLDHDVDFWTYAFRPIPGWQWVTIELASSGAYERDLWQDFSALGPEPRDVELWWIETRVSGDMGWDSPGISAAATFDDFWIGP